MNVLIINTSEKIGGAAVAARRLMEALNKNGVEAKMLVRDKESNSQTVYGLPSSWRLQWHFLWERLVIWIRLHLKREHLFEIDISNSGTDITKLSVFKEADIIHLHWVNQGMLSLNIIHKILKTGKPVVWTMHDAWPFTGICHLTMGCKRFKTSCKNCKYLPGGGGENDLASKVWKKKKDIFEHHGIFFVVCSKWLEGEAKQSALLDGQNIICIPNPIDTKVFKCHDKEEAKKTLGLPLDKKLILFVSQRVTNANKGMTYLVEACRLLAEEHPEIKEQCAVVMLGGHAEEMEGKLTFQTFPLSYITDERKIVEVYNAVDVFVLPSLSENLPNTIMEAMACGVPCVGFKTGGIPEMIEHRQNGYVANYRDANDLSAGIYWTLYEANQAQLRENALHKVTTCYSQSSVSAKYREVYAQALERTRKK